MRDDILHVINDMFCTNRKTQILKHHKHNIFIYVTFNTAYTVNRLIQKQIKNNTIDGNILFLSQAIISSYSCLHLVTNDQWNIKVRAVMSICVSETIWITHKAAYYVAITFIFIWTNSSYDKIQTTDEVVEACRQSMGVSYVSWHVSFLLLLLYCLKSVFLYVP